MSEETVSIVGHRMVIQAHRERIAKVVTERNALRARITALEAERDKLVAALELVQRGIWNGKIKDQSILPKPKPNDTEVTPIALSEIIADALRAAAGAKP
jgi:hypothetical protein